ncbi:hypothetical protein QF026_003909 [Streptomyces aurantiacus]|uniref:hypothetical protein n=1 Tax=Streptomyces aurantiacus TaxID=47760 RepID=UPI002794DB7A|nr:hypothetical protein [Streptomyces aurantiacus]MDQ0775443.1 hypothetical protein [Streptomyces aurantiacus]
MRRTLMSWAVVTTLTLAAAVSVTACTSGSEDKAPDVAGGDKDKQGKQDGKSGQDGARDPKDIAAAYTKCMREQGHEVTVDEFGRVRMPAMGAGSQGQGAGEDMPEAVEKCDKQVPGMAQLKEKGDAGSLKQARGMAQCLRENGIPDMPDPDPKKGALSVPKDAVGKKWTKAMSVCGDKFPGAAFAGERAQ